MTVRLERSTIVEYYDATIDGRLRDFTYRNPRIEAAISTIAGWSPDAPARALEIGCGVGATAWRLARAWPNAQVVGFDISPASIAVAQRCFRLPNLRYCDATLEACLGDGPFDLIVLMDVYEHIAPEDRSALHIFLRRALSSESRMIVTAPTPALQHHDRIRNPGAMQPIDEDVTASDLARLAVETDTRLLYFREVDIWECGDYLHAVFARCAELGSLKSQKKRWFEWLRSRRFWISSRERRRLASLWTEPPSTSRRLA